MKGFFLFIAGLFFIHLQLPAQHNKAELIPQDTTLLTPQITFVDQEYDFGKIRKGEKIHTSYFFKNTGTRPLRLLQVQTSCGCTATDWTKKAIAPNETGEIKVTFDTLAKDNITGMQKKILLVISNAKDKEVPLVLKGEVFQGEN